MSKKNLKTKAVDVAKTIAKVRDNYTCQKCGATRETRMIHGAHIMPVTYGATAADPDNILALCSTCHSMGKNSAHQDPIQYGLWFEEKYPGKYAKLREKAIAYDRNPFPKIDWEEVRIRLKKELDTMEKD